MCYLITQGLSFMAQILDCYALCHLRHLSLHISMLFSLAQRDSVRRLVEFTEFQVSQALQRTMYYAASNNKFFGTFEETTEIRASHPRSQPRGRDSFCICYLHFCHRFYTMLSNWGPRLDI